MTRKKITELALAESLERLENAVGARLVQKGWGGFVSRHEILGAVAEEDAELIEAVHRRGLGDVHVELLDVAVACVIGLASISVGSCES